MFEHRPPCAADNGDLEEAISKIFDDVDAAKTIEEVNSILDTAASLDTEGQAAFVLRLRTDFNARAARKKADVFSVAYIEPLNKSDLKEGFRILFHKPVQ